MGTTMIISGLIFLTIGIVLNVALLLYLTKEILDKIGEKSIKVPTIWELHPNHNRDTPKQAA